MKSNLNNKMLSIGYVCAALLMVPEVLLANSSPASEPIYLTQPRFHHGANANLRATPGNVRVAVDNDGRYLADE